MTKPVSDPLKPFNKILEPDVRSAFYGVDDPNVGMRQGTLEEYREEISQITINEFAPDGVRQLFETAKNLVLYSWFVYRFHQPAELCAFSAVEMALRDKVSSAEELAAQDPPRRKRSLRSLLEEARARGWVRNEDFPQWQKHQQLAAWHKANYEQIEDMMRLGLEEAPSPRLEDFEGAIGDPDYDYISVLANSLPQLRNNLAHGSLMLHPESLGTLQICAQLINQIFRVNDG